MQKKSPRSSPSLGSAKEVFKTYELVLEAALDAAADKANAEGVKKGKAQASRGDRGPAPLLRFRYRDLRRAQDWLRFFLTANTESTETPSDGNGFHQWMAATT